MPIGEFIGEIIGEFVAEFLIKKIFGGILNFIGGTTRWIYGTIWRTIFNKPKFKYSEYINGPEESDDWHDNNHGCVNIIIGIVIIVFAIFLLVF